MDISLTIFETLAHLHVARRELIFPTHPLFDAP